MKKYLIALITAPLCFSFNFAQAQSDVKKKIEKEVEVKVDDESGEMVKTIKMMIKEGDGEEKIMVWTGTDESEMSDEMKEHMEDVHIEIETENDEQSEEIEKEISITLDDKSGEMIKTVEIISEENGEKKVMTWKGGENDEMPEEIKEQMKDVKVIVVDGKEMKATKKSIKKEKKVKYRIIKDNDDEKIIEWDGEGEMPKEIKEKLEKEGVKIKEGNVMIFKSDGGSEDNVVIMSQGNKKIRLHANDGENIFVYENDDSSSKPKLGVMIENHVDGIEVKSVIEDSVAETSGLKPGDIIFKIDEKYIGSSLQLTDYLDKVEDGKQITLKVLRKGSEKTLKVNLEKE